MVCRLSLVAVSRALFCWDEWASHCGGFPCGTQALGAWAS